MFIYKKLLSSCVFSAALRTTNVVSQASGNSVPVDISPIHSDLISQNFDSYTFPKNRSNRSFQLQWFDKFPWIEYSKSLDAVFCYACRQFGIYSNIKEETFISVGFTNWQIALTKKQRI